MNIIIDVTRLVRHIKKGKTLTGIDRVNMAYVEHYKHTAQALIRFCGRSWVLPRSQSHALFMWCIKPSSSLFIPLLILKGRLSFKKTTRNGSLFLLNTGHINRGRSDYYRLVKTLNVKPVYMVHDLIPITYPEYCGDGEDLRHKKKMNDVLTLAKGIITNSLATLHDLNDFAIKTNQMMKPAKVALLAPGFPLFSPKLPLLNKPYFVILSTIEPRKNHALLLQLWRQLAHKFGSQTPHLVVIGQRGWECEHVIDLLDRCPSLKALVTEVGRCTDQDLVTYISHCQALLFPSFIEGYGLPLVEALALGVPVIASDLAVFREIAGDIPDYIDPLDGKRWEELIIDYATPNSASRNAQIQRIQHFKQPTWAEHFSIVDSFLATLDHEESGLPKYPKSSDSITSV